MATQSAYRLLTAKEFLDIDFGDHKAELDNGVIRMMAGGVIRHSRIQSNLIMALGPRLRGSGCAPHGSDIAVRTGDFSIRYPDVAVFCGRESNEHDGETSADDPRVVIEILSAGTARTDLNVKVPEYKALQSVATIVLIDIASERLHVHQRTPTNGWHEQAYAEPVDLDLPSLGITIPHEEIFARD